MNLINPGPWHRRIQTNIHTSSWQDIHDNHEHRPIHILVSDIQQWPTNIPVPTKSGWLHKHITNIYFNFLLNNLTWKKLTNLDRCILASWDHYAVNRMEHNSCYCITMPGQTVLFWRSRNPIRRATFVLARSTRPNFLFRFSQTSFQFSNLIIEHNIELLKICLDTGIILHYFKSMLSRLIVACKKVLRSKKSRWFTDQLRGNAARHPLYFYQVKFQCIFCSNPWCSYY